MVAWNEKWEKETAMKQDKFDEKMASQPCEDPGMAAVVWVFVFMFVLTMCLFGYYALVWMI